MARSPRRGALAFVAALLLMLACASQASAATYSVNTTDDTDDAALDGTCADGSGKCSLRAAFDEANDNEGADEIALPAGHYVFRSDGTALQVETGMITLKGAGAADTIVDSDGWDSAFFVNPNSTFDASGITVTGGRGCGCGGGAVASLGATVKLTDARLTRNEVSEGAGGAIGALFSLVELTRVRVDHNTAFFGGGGIFSLAGELHVTDSQIDGNVAIGDGGAIANESLEICECEPVELLPQLEGTALGATAGLIDEEEFSPGLVDINGSTLNDNFSGARGGALFNSTAFGDVIIGSVTGSHTGEEQPPALGTITNSTISGNTAGTAFGGLCADEGGCAGAGGGIYHDSEDQLDLTNDTVVENHVVGADEQIEGFNSGGNIGTSGVVNLRNTIVADGNAGGVRNNCSSYHEGNRFTSHGNNLESTAPAGPLDGCNLTEPSDKPNTDPKLAPLGDNGGLTPTHALRDGSPAIDAGTNAAGPALDQRGGDRPPAGGSAGETRDIGAYEAYSLADLSIEAKAAAPNPATAGSPLTYNLVVRNSGPDKVTGATLSDALPSGLELVSADGCTGGVTCALGPLAPGDVKVVTVVVRPTTAGTVENSATVSAAGIIDTKPANDSASTTTQVNAAPPVQQQQPQQQPGGQPEQDKDLDVNLTGPKTSTIDQFMNGIVVEADCTDEACLRRFREHAAINTGASHIAGFNLTISRAVLGRGNKKTRIRLRPCQSGSKNGRRHKRCVRNLRKAAKKAKKFKVKVVVSAVDAAGNKDYAKTFVNVGG